MTPEQMLESIENFVVTHDATERDEDCDCATGLPLSDERDRWGNCPQGYLCVCIHEARKVQTVGDVLKLLEKRPRYPRPRGAGV